MCHHQMFLNLYICVRLNCTPLQYSCLENPMDGGVWKATVHGVAEGRTRLSDFTFTFHFHVLEKEMATHSSVLAWRIPGTGEPGGLQSMGLRAVGTPKKSQPRNRVAHKVRSRVSKTQRGAAVICQLWMEKDKLGGNQRRS